MGGTTTFDGFLLAYGADASRLAPELRAKFVELGLDDDTRAWLRRTLAAPHGRARTMAQRVLRHVVSDFDANGLLGMYPMHLVSQGQFTRLLGDVRRGSLLDVGAGSGDVTRVVAPLFERVVVTELSKPMCRRLRDHGYRALSTDLTVSEPPEPPYDVVACLNVLDRCPRPHTLLGRLVRWVAPGGRLVVALALPLRPWFYDGPTTRDPTELLECAGDSWEERVAALDRNVLAPAGLAIETFARAPYLSAGDAERRLYVLDDVVAVCRVRDAESP